MATRAHMQAHGEASPCGHATVIETAGHIRSRLIWPKLHLATFKIMLKEQLFETIGL